MKTLAFSDRITDQMTYLEPYYYTSTIYVGFLQILNSLTSRKVAGSIPDCVIGIFHSHNTPGRTMALGSTQPLTEMSARNFSWGVKAAGA